MSSILFVQLLVVQNVMIVTAILRAYVIGEHNTNLSIDIVRHFWGWVSLELYIKKILYIVWYNFVSGFTAFITLISVPSSIPV